MEPIPRPQLDINGSLTQDAQIPEELTSDPELATTYAPNSPIQPPKRWFSKLSAVSRQISRLHRETPFLRRLPSFVMLPVTLLILVNGAAWAIAGIVLRYYPYLRFHISLIIELSWGPSH